MSVEDSPANAEMCLCPGCPTYNECMRDAGELLFCARGATGCGPRAVSCICGDCPVWQENSLTGHYFCMQGAAG